MLEEKCEMMISNIEKRMEPFLPHLGSGIVIAGGTSQGLRAGDRLAVYQRGRIVKNPQTGMDLELPGLHGDGEKIILSPDCRSRQPSPPAAIFSPPLS